MDLPDAVHAVVVGVNLHDPRHRGRVAHRTRGRRSGLGRLVRARGDLSAGLRQGRADRLDPEPVAVLVDVLDEHRGRHSGAYFSLRSSSAAAKNADAVRRISFTRRSSLTSRSSSAIRFASAVVTPGRWPSSTSACWTQLRNVSELIPSWSPTRLSAPDLVSGSRRSSTAILIARSRSSSGYFLGAAMTLILPWIESLHQ